MLNPSKSESYPHSLMHFSHCHVIESKNSRLIGHHICCKRDPYFADNGGLLYKTVRQWKRPSQSVKFSKLDLTSIQYENFLMKNMRTFALVLIASSIFAVCLSQFIDYPDVNDEHVAGDRAAPWWVIIIAIKHFRTSCRLLNCRKTTKSIPNQVGPKRGGQKTRVS